MVVVTVRADHIVLLVWIHISIARIERFVIVIIFWNDRSLRESYIVISNLYQRSQLAKASRKFSPN